VPKNSEYQKQGGKKGDNVCSTWLMWREGRPPTAEVLSDADLWLRVAESLAVLPGAGLLILWEDVVRSSGSLKHHWVSRQLGGDLSSRCSRFLFGGNSFPAPTCRRCVCSRVSTPCLLFCVGASGPLGWGFDLQMLASHISNCLF